MTKDDNKGGKSNENHKRNERVNGEMQDKKAKRQRILIAMAVLVIALLVGVIIYLLTRPEPPAETVDPRGARGVVATPENIEEILALMQEPIEDGYYEARMNVDWVFDTSRTPSSNAFVANAESNTRTVFFDVTLDETGEVVYSSPLIPVGAQLTGFSLDADIPGGVHPAVVIYHLVDDDENVLSTVSVAIRLIVGG